MSDEISNEELNRVNNALSALSQHNNQATPKEWDTIMEEATRQRKNASRKAKYISAAASVAVVLAIITTVFVTTRDNNETDTADKTKKETATTKALSERDRLLKNTYYVKYTSSNSGSYEVYDSETNKPLGSASSYGNTNEGRLIHDYYNDIATGDITLACDSNITSEIEKTSPDKSKSLHVSYSCLENNVEIEISGKKSVVKPSNLGPVDQGDGTERDLIRTLQDVYWINDTEFIGRVWDTFYDDNGTILSDGETTYLIYTASNNIDLSKGKAIKDFNSYCCTDTERHIMDVINEGSETYILVYQGVETGQGDETNIEIKHFVIALSTGKTVWEIDLSKYVAGDFKVNAFGSTYTDIYGSVYLDDDEAEYGYGFAYSNSSDTFVDSIDETKPLLILPKR